MNQNFYFTLAAACIWYSIVRVFPLIIVTKNVHFILLALLLYVGKKSIRFPCI